MLAGRTIDASFLFDSDESTIVHHHIIEHDHPLPQDTSRSLAAAEAFGQVCRWHVYC
jgi:hypothetical protein